jgi:hypothetical protein
MTKFDLGVTRAAIITATFASLVGGLLLNSGTASATTLDAPPTFECYTGLAATINGGNLTVDELLVADDSAITAWVPVIYRWNAGGWRVYERGRREVFSDGGFGDLTESPQDFSVRTKSYYAVKIVTVSTGDASSQDIWAKAMMGGDPIGSEVCTT